MKKIANKTAKHQYNTVNVGIRSSSHHMVTTTGTDLDFSYLTQLVHRYTARLSKSPAHTGFTVYRHSVLGS